VHGALEPLLKRNGISLQFMTDEDITVRTDAALVQQVIINVMMNAIEAIAHAKEKAEAEARGRGHHIFVDMRKTIGGVAELLISNDGPPIPPGYGDRIFDKGVTTRPRGLGHGQGLYLCRQIARYLEGEFGFCPPHYEKPQGATVCFRLAFPLHKKYHEDLQASVAGVEAEDGGQ